jgi:hypothetical protein
MKQNKQLCECGHYKEDHCEITLIGINACNHEKKTKERKRDKNGEYQTINCVYICNCNKFKLRKGQ